MPTYDSVINRSKADALIPVEVSQEILKHVPEQSAVMSLARRAPDMAAKVRETPVLAALPTAFFVNGDIGLKQTTEISWDKVNLVAEEIAVIVPIPEAVLEDAAYDIWGELRPLIVEAFGRTFDRAVIYGDNKPASWPAAVVPAAAAKGHVIAAGTGADLYDDIFGLDGVIAAVEEDGFMVNGHIAALGLRARMRSVRAGGTGAPLLETGIQSASRYALDGEPLVFPKNGGLDPAQSLLISGDWQNLIYAMRKDLTFKIFTEGIIQDSAGNTVYNLMQQDMVAMRCVMRVAYALPTILTPLGTAASKFPFAVLAPEAA